MGEESGVPVGPFVFLAIIIIFFFRVARKKKWSTRKRVATWYAAVHIYKKVEAAKRKSCKM